MSCETYKTARNVPNQNPFHKRARFFLPILTNTVHWGKIVADWYFRYLAVLQVRDFRSRVGQNGQKEGGLVQMIMKCGHGANYEKSERGKIKPSRSEVSR